MQVENTSVFQVDKYFRFVKNIFAVGFDQDLGLATVWDDHLCYILTPALSAYETERLTGLLFHFICCDFVELQ